MKSLRQAYPNKKGFSLIELVLGITIASILLMCLYSLLIYNIKLSKMTDEKDDALSNGRYALLYIKDEIKSADKIIDISKFKNLDERYPNNIGFVILHETIDEEKTNYNYNTYYLKEDKLVRLACNWPRASYPRRDFFAGHNDLCKGLKSLEKFVYDSNKNVLKIRLTLNNGREDHNFKSDVFLNCPLDLRDGGQDE